MSKVKLSPIVESARGVMIKGSGMVFRKKTFRAPSGKVMREGVQESYAIINPRDYSQNPPKGRELANINIFAESKRLSSQIINSEKVTEAELSAMMPAERAEILEYQSRLQDLRERFYAQFKRPDPEAPFEKKPRPNSVKLVRKQYCKLDNFIQAIIREKLLNAKSL